MALRKKTTNQKNKTKSKNKETKTNKYNLSDFYLKKLV